MPNHRTRDARRGALIPLGADDFPLAAVRERGSLVRGVLCIEALERRHSTEVLYSTLSSLRNREIETETLIFAPISLSYIEID